MAKSKKAPRTDLDWYLVSIDRLKKFAIVIVVLLLAGGGYYYYDHQRRDPQLRAQRAVTDAEESLNQLASSPSFGTLRSEFERARMKLDEAKSLLHNEKYPESESAAIESQTISTSAMARSGQEKDSDAQFLSVEGDVQFQKSSNADWKKADPRTPLFNGDWVKTGDNASAELIFANGSLYTVGPNALLEIYAIVNPGTSKKQNSVQMQVGSVEINTSDDISTVKTPGTQVVVNSESTAQVGVDQTQKATNILNLKGSSSVTSAAGGTAVQLASGEAIRATKEGSLSSKRLYLPPPALLGPGDNQVFRGAVETKVQFAWSPVNGAANYQLQVSRSRLFAGLEINATRQTPNAQAKVTSEGSFYWRVASVDANGEAGPFSPFRRFRVTGLAASSQTQQGVTDRTPPTLQLERPFRIGGGNYIIKGRVEPGSTVFINDDEADVGADGTFQKLVTYSRGMNNVVVKAVDPAGNETVQTEKVFVEESE